MVPKQRIPTPPGTRRGALGFEGFPSPGHLGRDGRGDDGGHGGRARGGVEDPDRGLRSAGDSVRVYACAPERSRYFDTRSSDF